MNNRLFSRNDLVRLIIPLIVDQFLQVAVGLSDSIMVARVGRQPSLVFPWSTRSCFSSSISSRLSPPAVR